MIADVLDTTIDRRTGRGPDATLRAPVPVGPVLVRMPVAIGGEKRMDAPAEELTVKLATGKLVQIVQERGSPPFAIGEAVRVQKEKPSELTGESRTRVVRDDDSTPLTRSR